MEVTAEQIEEIKKKINHLEYDEIKDVKSEIQGIKQDMIRSNLLLEQNISSSEKLSETLSTVQDTMITLTNSMRNNNEATSNLSEKVTNLENKIDTIDENSKIDVNKWLKDRLFNIVIAIGVVLYIVFGKYITF